MHFGMSLINSFTHIQENWKFVIICVQNQWGVVHPWHGTVANLWGRHKDFTEFNENFEKSYLLNGLSNIVKFFTVWFLKIFCIKRIHIFFWVQCSFKRWIASVCVPCAWVYMYSPPKVGNWDKILILDREHMRNHGPSTQWNSYMVNGC